jgi:hypothetical protein
MAMPRVLVIIAAVGVASIDQPTTRPKGIQHHRAIELALAGGVLGHVGDP